MAQVSTRSVPLLTAGATVAESSSSSSSSTSTTVGGESTVSVAPAVLQSTVAAVGIAVFSASSSSADVASCIGLPPAGSACATTMAATAVVSSAAPTTIPVTADESHDLNRDTSNTDVANTKEKTPMCLINELARYNKIQHQYHLTDEDGPAHKKTFTVLLRLGGEEYRSSGSSIKRAQQTAAGEALEKTNYKQRPPKSGKTISRFVGILTPTVELNALAMKRGEPAVYSVLEQSRSNNTYSPPNFNFRGAYNQRYHYPRYPRPCYVSLRVGNRAFVGEGSTVQIARHNAAEKALKSLQDVPVLTPDESQKCRVNEAAATVAAATITSNGVGDNIIADGSEEDGSGSGINIGVIGNNNDELKSPISLVHEVALKRNLRVDFEVTRESGPPHMRTFLTKCIVGEMVTEGEGNAKKLSKKRAAEKMLDELKKLPALPPVVSLKIKKKKKNPVKKKSRNLIKEQKANPEYGQGINPISRLIQIQQAKREKEPVYSLVTEGGLPRRREFVMRVQVGTQSCNGTGPNKKLAKRSAAEALLQTLGYSRPVSSITDPPSPSIANKPSSVGTDFDSDKSRKVTFLDGDGLIGVIGDRGSGDCGEGRSGRQLVPGLLLMPEVIMSNESLANVNNFHQHQNTSGQNVGVNRASGALISIQDSTITAIAKELLISGLSPTAEAISKSVHNEIAGQRILNRKHQLAYLADVLSLTVQFTDFPRGNKREFLSLVSLSTNPPQVSHGAGDTLEASHDEAALNALQSLAGRIDSVSSYVKKEQSSSSSGDGVHVGSGPAQNGTAKLVDSPGVVGELPNNVC